MPQVVEVAGNNNARQILRRDLRNLTEHLARFDARLLRFADCGDGLFHHLMRGTLDLVVGPEIGAAQPRGGGGGGGRRGRDAERGRAGRDKGQRPGAGVGLAASAGAGAGPSTGPPGGQPRQPSIARPPGNPGGPHRRRRHGRR
jgi:hypothetical protein